MKNMNDKKWMIHQNLAFLRKSRQLSLEEVAELAGFSNANYLLRVFKKSTGKAIGQYRKQIKF